MRSIALTDLSPEVNALQLSVDSKIAAGLFTDVNSRLDGKLSISTDSVQNLLASISYKARRCEELFYAILDFDNSQIPTTPFPLPNHLIDTEFTYGTSSKTVTIAVTDLASYDELLLDSFRSFILTVASLYENIVTLCETLLKKTIIFAPQKTPLSTPLDMLRQYHTTLMKLDYRATSPFHTCIDSYSTYFDKFLPIIGALRNSYIHGYGTNYFFDSVTYNLTHNMATSAFGRGPEIELNNFASSVLTNSIQFTREMLQTINGIIVNSPDTIPI